MLLSAMAAVDRGEKKLSAAEASPAASPAVAPLKPCGWSPIEAAAALETSQGALLLLLREDDDTSLSLI